MSYKDFDIALVVPGLPFDGETLEKRSLGGSESAAIYMAKALAKEGARVTVFCNTENPGQDPEGARYLPLPLWQKYKSVPHDVAIVQRVPEIFSARANSKLNYLWCHDLAHGRQAQTFRSVAWNIDKVMVLSEFMRGQYAKVLDLPDDRMMLTRNGVDLAAFKDVAASLRATATGSFERNPKRIIYVSRPERGLDVLLSEVMPRLLEKDPTFELLIGGYDNPVPHMADFYAECDRMAAKLGDHVRKLPPLTKRDLYREYMGAGCYVYPTPSPKSPKFREISCITAMECMAAGLPFIASDCGALRETVGEPCGELLVPLADGRPNSDALVERILQATNDEALRGRMVAAGRERASLLDWSGVAKDWLAEFEAELRERSSHRRTMINHFWRTSDIMAAKSLIAGDASEEAAEARRLLYPFAFVDELDGFRRQYEAIGQDHGGLDVTTCVDEPRFKVLESFFRDRPDIRSVVDYGCAHGAYAVNLATKFPHLVVLGLDIDKHGIAMGANWAKERGLEGRAEFKVLDVMNPSPGDEELHGAADCVLMQEILEHVKEPWVLASRVERFARKGGRVHITVPFGPWEYDSYHTYKNRCHIWHFDRHDMTEMFGGKTKLKIDSYYYGDSVHTGEPLGWWIVTYEADHEDVRPIDMARKLWLCKPRQTVTAGLIAGPGCEETIAWTLRSIYHVADEILIGDTGMGQSLRDVIDMLDHENPLWRWKERIQVFDAPNPREHGFDVARNAVLERARMDWFFWIDTDERLIGVQNMWKYLRENCYHGYGVRQHHFAVDTTFQPDMPVRLFRRRPLNGETMRFFGSIHEHPEIGMNKGPGPVVVLSDINIAHTGYLNEDVRQRRFLRNWPLLKMDQERNPERLLSKHMLMRDNIHLVRYALGQNGGRADGEIRRLCRETVELFQKHFLGKPGFTNTDSIQYYSEALKVLGEGFEVAWQFEAELDKEPQVNGTSYYRFANSDDLMKAVQFHVRQKVEKFEQEYY